MIEQVNHIILVLAYLTPHLYEKNVISVNDIW